MGCRENDLSPLVCNDAEQSLECNLEQILRVALRDEGAIACRRGVADHPIDLDEFKRLRDSQLVDDDHRADTTNVRVQTSISVKTSSSVRELFPERDAIVFDDQRLTYSKTWNACQRKAAHACLRDVGRRAKGDRVGMVHPERPRLRRVVLRHAFAWARLPFP